MVLEVDTKTEQVNLARYACFLEFLGVSNPRSLEHEGGTKSASGNNNLLTSSDDFLLQLSWIGRLRGHRANCCSTTLLDNYSASWYCTSGRDFMVQGMCCASVRMKAASMKGTLTQISRSLENPNFGHMKLRRYQHYLSSEQPRKVSSARIDPLGPEDIYVGPPDLDLAGLSEYLTFNVQRQ